MYHFFLIFQGLVQDLNKSKPCPRKVEEELHPLEKSVPLYIITATYPRLEQLAELTRLGKVITIKYRHSVINLANQLS